MPFEPIRQEVVKVLINRLNTGKDAVTGDLHFALLKQNRFADVHQVALDEWQMMLRQFPQTSDVVVTMLREFLTSPFKAIRDGAFDIALRELKHCAQDLTNPFGLPVRLLILEKGVGYFK